MQTEQNVTNTAADQIGLVAGLVQPVQDFQGVVGNLAPGDVVLIAWNNFLAHPDTRRASALGFADCPADELFDTGKNHGQSVS